MALTATEEALVRQLLDQQAAILSLAGNEATITSKLGATKVTLSDLVAASAVNDADLLLIRQGTNDKSVTGAIIKALSAQPDASEIIKGLVELATTAEAQALASALLALTPSTLNDALKGSNQSLAASGYQKLPGGLILQWGFSFANAAGSVITFPIAFPTALLNICTGIANNTNGVLQTYAFSTTQFTFRGDNEQHWWLAIGH